MGGPSRYHWISRASSQGRMPEALRVICRCRSGVLNIVDSASFESEDWSVGERAEDVAVARC